jgi:peroxiredoxin/Tfp pilus assembly protein PilF
MHRFILSFTLVLCLVGPVRAQNSRPEADPQFQQQFHAGREALATGKNKEALEAFKKANKLKNNSCADCYINMAVVYLRIAEVENAVTSCDKALGVSGDDQTKATAHSMKGTALLSLSNIGDKNLRDAEAEYRAATELDKSEPIFHLNLATALLRQSKDEEARDELSKCLMLHPAKPIADRVNQLLTDPRLGRENVAPDFRLTTLQGQDISLRQLRGNIVVLDFWATWCPPCRASVSELKDLTRKYANAKVVLISISGDKDEKAWRDFVAKKKMDWPQYLDTNDSVMSSFAVRAFPTYMVIDGDGFIKQRITGMNPQETVVHRLKATLQAMPQLEGMASK